MNLLCSMKLKLYSGFMNGAVLLQTKCQSSIERPFLLERAVGIFTKL